MSITEIIPTIKTLSYSDKLKLTQFLLTQLAREEGILLQGLKNISHEDIWFVLTILADNMADRDGSVDIRWEQRRKFEQLFSKLLEDIPLEDIPLQDQFFQKEFSQKEDDALWGIIGIAEGEETAVAQNYDQHLLYSTKE